MGTRLYVGNLSHDATPDSLRAVFAVHGDVNDVHIVFSRDTGRPRGFAFITMGTAEQATTAATKMNGALVDGRPLRVNETDGRRALAPARR
jgi:RNA recognition motif-containing protein